MKQIEIKSNEWNSLVNDIVQAFAPGELISHDFLKRKFTFENLDVANYSTTAEFIEDYQNQQFAYMTLIDTLRWQMLEENNLFLRNIRGDGYILLPPKDQVQYGYDEFMKTIKDAIGRADQIMTHVQAVPRDQQAKDNDIRAKCSLLKQMLNGVRR